MLLKPGTGTLSGRRYEHLLRLPRMLHQKVGIPADLMLQIGPLLPGLATVCGHVHADARGDMDLVGIQWIDHNAVHVIVHPWDHLEGTTIIGALQ
jgi:hypothetical protein